MIDKEALLKTRLPEAEVPIPGVGTVRVRGLSRGEVFGTQKAKDTAVMERKILAFGMLDPVLTEAEVQRWQEACPAGELDPVVDKIRELSGLSDTSEKEAVLDFREGSDDGVRALPGAEAEHDGGGSAGADGQ
jgi:hypothetical protein